VLWAIRQVTPEGFRRLLPALAWLYLMPALLFAAAALATPGAGWPRLALSLLAGGVTVAVYLWRFGSGFLRFFAAGAEARGEDPTPTPGSSAAQ
jgi:hypothetical protein